jgi:putative flippase GtrA
MRLGVAGEAARFLAVGAFSYSFGIGLAAFLREVVGLGADVSVGLSLGTLLITNFWLARLWVFRASGRADRQFARFAAASFGMRGGEYSLFWLLTHSGGVHYLISLTAAMAVSTCLKFLLYRTAVFGTRVPPDQLLVP